MKGMTLKAMAEATGGVYYGSGEDAVREVSAISTDSRKIEKDSLFVAIKGERSDGHDYIGQCYASGALCVISEHELPVETRAYILVKSSLQALKDLATLYRNNLDVKVVGITGSVGKTSTKETVSAVLAEKYRVLKTLGNFNNEIGLPLTVFRLTEDDEVAVLEMGISDFGEMDRLSAIARPDICVITNIGLCHLENLGTRDGILKAKTEIFNHMNPQGTVILNGDDDKLVTISQVNGKKPEFFGVTERNGVYADNIESLGLDGTSFTIHGLAAADGVSSFDVMIPVPGKHMVYNALAASLVGAKLGLTSEQIKRGIGKVKTIAGRSNLIRENGYMIIDDCYNANPVSMKAALDLLGTAIGRKVAILGDMFELGENEKQMHYDVGTYLGAGKTDVLITVGELAEQIADGARDYLQCNGEKRRCDIRHYGTKDEMLECIGQILESGDNILVKASHGMEFAGIVDYLKSCRA